MACGSPKAYKRATQEDLPTQPLSSDDAPICEADGVQIKDRIGIVPILRAGPGVVDR